MSPITDLVSFVQIKSARKERSARASGVKPKQWRPAWIETRLLLLERQMTFSFMNDCISSLKPL